MVELAEPVPVPGEAAEIVGGGAAEHREHAERIDRDRGDVLGAAARRRERIRMIAPMSAATMAQACIAPSTPISQR